jgi:hypothetical protein
MALAQDPLAQGLSGYWKLDETAGPAADSSGNGLTGTWSGGVSAMAPGNAKLQFADPNCAVMDGSSSAITVPANRKLDITGDFSIALWIYPTADARGHDQGLLAKGFMPIRNYVLLRQDDKTLYLQSFSSKGQFLQMAGVKPVPSNTWTHVAVTWTVADGKTLATLYLNGVVDRTLSVPGTPEASPDPLVIGTTSSRPAWQDRFQGRMDEVRLYHRALSPAEVELLASGHGPASPAPQPAGSKH